MPACPCRSGRDYETCCRPYHAGTAWPATAEALMRSRYCAFARRDIAWLKASLWPKFQKTLDVAGLKEWAGKKHWIGLEILRVEQGGEADEKGLVLFIARSLEGGEIRDHREYSVFKKKKGRWYYVSAVAEDDAKSLVGL